MKQFLPLFLIFILLIKGVNSYSQIKFTPEFNLKMTKYALQYSKLFFDLSPEIKTEDFKPFKNSKTLFGSNFLMFKNPKQKINVAFYIDTCYNHYNIYSEVRHDLPVIFGIAENSEIEFKSFNKFAAMLNSDETILFAIKDAIKSMSSFIDYKNTFVCCLYNNYSKAKIYYVFNLEGDVESRLLDYSEILMELSFNPHPSNTDLEPQLVIPSGTNSPIYTLACSSSGQLLAYAGEQGAIKILLGDGTKELRTIYAHNKQINKICFSNNEKLIASCSNDSTIKLWEVETGKLVTTLNGHNNIVNEIGFFDYDSKIISTSNDSTIKLWDLEKKHSYKTINGSKNKTSKLEFTPDNKAVIDLSDGSLMLLNLKTSEFSTFNTSFKNIVDIACPYSDIIFITDGISVKSHNIITHLENIITDETDSAFTMLAYKKFDDSNINLVMLTHHGFSQTLDYVNYTLINKFQYTNFGNDEKYFDLVYNSNYNLLIYSSTHYCLSYNLTTKEFNPIWGAGFIPRSIDIDDNSKTLIINYGKGFGPSLLSLKNGRIIWNSYNTALEKNSPAKISKNSGNILSVSPENEICAYDYLQGRFIYKFSPVSIPLNFINVQNDSSFIYRTNNNEIYFHKPALKTDKLITKEYTTIDNVLTLIKDTFILAQDNKNIYLLNIFNNTKIVLDTQKQYFVIKTYTADNKNIAIRTSDTLISIYALKSLKKINSFAGNKYTYTPFSLSLNSNKNEIAISYWNNELLIFDYNTGNLIKKWKPHSQSLLGITYSSDGRFLITCSNDYSIRFWETENYTQVLANYTVPLEDSYITRTVNDSKSYYVASSNIQKKSTTTLAYYSYGNNVLDLSDLDLEYNRPALIADVLGYESDEIINAYKKLYEKRLKKLNLSNSENFLSAKRPILNPIYTFPPTVTQSKVKFFFKLYSSSCKLKSLKVSINEVPVFGINGAETVDGVLLNNYNSLPLAFSLFLNNGENKISIKITDENNIESFPYNLNIFYKNDTIIYPKLHIIGIGISEFENKKFNLKYPVKDIIDFIKQFQNQRNVYREIIVDTLINQMATLENILKLKDKIYNNFNEDSVNVNDKVILFLATHGILAQNYDYYLATYNINFDNPSENGLLYSEIENMLDKIPPRNKVVLLDACHSGEIDKDEVLSSKKETVTANNDLVFRAASTAEYKLKEGILKNSLNLMKEMFMDLRKTSGATVISSAGGTEYAIEGDEWQNGVFTYSLINAIKYHKADANNDNKVYLSELKNYLEQEVPKITNGKQQPTSRSENISNDILIWSNDFNEELASAIKLNDKELAYKLINEGANVSTADTNGASILMWAVLYSDLEMVKKLINLKADINAQGIIYNNSEKTSYYGSLLAIATAKNKMDILKYLIEEQGFNVNECEYSIAKKNTGWTPLLYAISNSNIEIFNYLISKGADVNLYCSDDKLNAGLLAFSKNNLEICKSLIVKGINCLHTDTSLSTIVSQASYNENIEILKLAISNNREAINKADINGLYPISYAVYFAKKDNFELLIKNGAKTNIITKTGETILHIAAKSKSTEMFDEILKIEPELLNKQNDFGNTALLYAAINKDIKVAEYLCIKGADMSLKNNEGYNFESIAKYYEDSQLLDLVTKYSK